MFLFPPSLALLDHLSTSLLTLFASLFLLRQKFVCGIFGSIEKDLITFNKIPKYLSIFILQGVG